MVNSRCSFRLSCFVSCWLQFAQGHRSLVMHSVDRTHFCDINYKIRQVKDSVKGSVNGSVKDSVNGSVKGSVHSAAVLAEALAHSAAALAEVSAHSAAAVLGYSNNSSVVGSTPSGDKSYTSSR